MNQVIIGALLPYVIGLVLYMRRQARASLSLLIWTPAAMAMGALWAIIPDLPRAIGLHRLYARLAADPRIDIFCFHYTIDRYEHDSIAYTVLFVLMVISLLSAAWRELYLREHNA